MTDLEKVKEQLDKSPFSYTKTRLSQDEYIQHEHISKFKAILDLLKDPQVSLDDVKALTSGFSDKIFSALKKFIKNNIMYDPNLELQDKISLLNTVNDKLSSLISIATPLYKKLIVKYNF